MATMLPPVKGAAFSFEVGLVSQADTDVFYTGPTIAEGDVKVIQAGGTAANITTLPTAVGSATWVLTCSLGTAEMNADRVTVSFKDADGSQWQDALVTIYTSAQTLDTIDTNVDSVLADTGTDGVVVANFTTAAKAELQTEADDALVARKLDHLVAVADADDVVDGSIIAKLASKASGTADWSTFVSTTDSLEALRDNIGTAGAGLTGLTATVAISAAAAASVASGALALRTYHTFSQAITSTSTAALNTATKVWLAIKREQEDADSASIAFVEATGGLTVLAGATYATTTNGTLVVTGSSGAWVVTATLQEAATALLGAYVGESLVAECKALVGGDTVAVWDGTATISGGIVRAYV